jgi:hypothetical protein
MDYCFKIYYRCDGDPADIPVDEMTVHARIMTILDLMLSGMVDDVMIKWLPLGKANDVYSG